MAPAQKRLEPDLRATKFNALRFPVVTNVDAEAITIGGGGARSADPPGHACRCAGSIPCAR